MGVGKVGREWAGGSGPFFTSEPKMAKLEELAQCFPKEDCHEFIMRNELHKRREHEYKEYYTFKHNLLQL